MSSEKRMIDVHFDEGHSSIGWSVTTQDKKNTVPVSILGTGVVLFPPDMCLTSERTMFRHARHNIRARASRISHIRQLLVSRGLLSEEDCIIKKEKVQPWKLAAQALSHGKVLSWKELYRVLVWYAHNRGYDGNRLASRKSTRLEEDGKGENKVTSRGIKEAYGTETMAETVCKILGIDPCDESNTVSSESYKDKKMTFPRDMVMGEVRSILENHKGKLEGVTDNLIHILLADPVGEKNCLKKETSLPFKTVNCYYGGILSGQKIPRFDNRIIGKCPISHHNVPSKACREFLDFRWAQFLSNVRIGLEYRPLTVDEISRINKEIETRGGFTKSEFKHLLADITHDTDRNLDNLLEQSDFDTNLVRYPGVFALRDFRDAIDARSFKRFANKLFNGKKVTLKELVESASTKEDKDKIIECVSKRKNKPLEDISYRATLPTGRARYSREVMKKAAEQVFAGIDPRKNGGILYRDPSESDFIEEKEIDKKTNNRLVRHRTTILLRLLKDIISEYADGDKSLVSSVTIEVARDIKDFTGKTSDEIKNEISKKSLRRNQAEAKLKSWMDKYGIHKPITDKLISKVLIAEDMHWTCPYTKTSYTVKELLSDGILELEHIIPHSNIQSDSLSSLVLSFRAVNGKKSNMTGLQFIRTCGGQTVEVSRVSRSDEHRLRIVSEKEYKIFIDTLNKDIKKMKDSGTGRARTDKKTRQKRIKNLETLSHKEIPMTDGMLTKTDSITAFSIKAIRGLFHNEPSCPTIRTISGKATAAIRRRWHINDILAEIDIRCKGEDGKCLPKRHLRNITHLHHAVDAIVIGLASSIFPHDGRFYSLLCKRHATEEEKHILESTGLFFFKGNEHFLRRIPDELRNNIKSVLAEKRIKYHLPKTKRMFLVEDTLRGLVPERKLPKDRDENMVYVWKNALKKNSDGAETCTKAKKTIESCKRGKAFGFAPSSTNGKLSALSAVKLCNGNFGIALTANPEIIRGISVWNTIGKIKKRNGGVMPEILRNCDIIEINKGIYKGRWVVKSVKDESRGITLDLSKCDSAVSLKEKNTTLTKDWQKRSALLRTIMASGLRVIRSSYTAGI